ncbi:MAG: VTT domain-containing protein [Thiohalocapsa sp.]|nr:VTT domain-containing protein [Thiohalocapsa sp.]MCF7991964.1 VTT domain-containing protein [Thiohalocapsa sp.]
MHDPPARRRLRDDLIRSPAAVLRWSMPAAVLLALLLAGLWVVWNHDLILEWKRQVDALPFFVLMALLPVLGFPITPLFVIAGATFGAVLGVIGSLAAVALNLLLCHWISQSGLRPYLRRWLAHTRYRLPELDDDRRSALRFALLVRITPGVPLVVKNYLIGLSGIPFRAHFGVSMVLTGVYATGFVLIGESMLAHNLAEALLGLAILAAAGLGLAWWRKRTANAAEKRRSSDF